ncbi:MAG: TraR/DksA C4-type zinc finger protein [Chloroflexi bacterium]|nr:TraR/DksA C4-type zinc finger protein [Chloroflexota bacterium]
MEVKMCSSLSDILQKSSARHDHMCPRQVLGARIGLAGLAALGIESPINKSTALIIVESDGCFADGIEAATGATVGHRTLHVNDFGKIAATFADVKTSRAIRISPALDVRERALLYAPHEPRHYFAQLQGYQAMPDADLLRIQEVALHPTLEELISKPIVRVNCDYCGEEIINEREVVVEGATLCRTCANDGYYLIRSDFAEMCAIMNHQSK